MRKPKKMWREFQEFFPTPEIATHIFRASDVTRIVGIEKWRLEKFLTGKQYRLSPSGRIGKGKGSWRIFSHEDLYRLAIANRMVEDGFTAKFVSFVLQEIYDNQLLDIDERCESRVTNVGVIRSKAGPRVLLGGPQHPYYVVPLRELVTIVNKRIAETERR